MTVRVSRGVAQVGSRLRFGILLGLGLLVGHDAVYAARFGVGDRLDAAMSAFGHDGWWDPFGLVSLLSAAALLVGSVVLIRTLRGRLARTGHARRASAMASLGAGYRAEFRALWPRLLISVIVAFAIQENVEAFLARGDVPGVDVLLGPGFPVAIVVLAMVTTVLAALGALIRWRIHDLEHQLRAALVPTRRRPSNVRPAREWGLIDSLAPHRWTFDRRDAGRAPPVALPA